MKALTLCGKLNCDFFFPPSDKQCVEETFFIIERDTLLMFFFLFGQLAFTLFGYFTLLQSRYDCFTVELET